MDQRVISCCQWGRLLGTNGAQKQELAVCELEWFEQHKHFHMLFGFLMSQHN